jgi:DNA polymerase III delta prime subunit
MAFGHPGSKEQNAAMHVVLYGPSGCGKSAVARAYAAARYTASITIDAAFENGVDTFRERIKVLARRRGPLTLIIVENADLLTAPCQQALRRLMERSAHICHFCFCVWDSPHALIPAILSRCAVMVPGDLAAVLAPPESVLKQKCI